MDKARFNAALLSLPGSVNGECTLLLRSGHELTGTCGHTDEYDMLHFLARADTGSETESLMDTRIAVEDVIAVGKVAVQ